MKYTDCQISQNTSPLLDAGNSVTKGTNGNTSPFRSTKGTLVTFRGVPSSTSLSSIAWTHSKLTAHTTKSALVRKARNSRKLSLARWKKRRPTTRTMGWVVVCGSWDRCKKIPLPNCVLGERALGNRIVLSFVRANAPQSIQFRRCPLCIEWIKLDKKIFSLQDCGMQ